MIAIEAIQFNHDTNAGVGNGVYVTPGEKL
jgi:hypothetical protein